MLLLNSRCHWRTGTLEHLYHAFSGLAYTHPLNCEDKKTWVKSPRCWICSKRRHIALHALSFTMRVWLTRYADVILHKADVVLGFGGQIVPLPGCWSICLPARQGLILHLNLLQYLHISYVSRKTMPLKKSSRSASYWGLQMILTLIGELTHDQPEMYTLFLLESTLQKNTTRTLVST